MAAPPPLTIARYAYRHWLRAGMTQWPTVRTAAHALRCRQQIIADDDGGDHYFTEGHNFQGASYGDLHIVATLLAVEVAWCAYWLPYSRGCYCGEHRP